MKHLNSTSSGSMPKGFTLIELIVVIGLFGIVSAILMSSLLSVYHFRNVIRFKKNLNFEASSILNNGIPGLVRSGFAIDYGKTVSTNSQELSEGMQEEVDQLSIFTDRAETQYFTIYRKPYEDAGDNADTAPLYIAFSNGQEFPLHSSEVVVEDFDVQVPTDLRVGGVRDIQPYTRLYLRLRNRYPFGEKMDEEALEPHETVRASYQTTITLRNSNAASYKTTSDPL